MNCKPRGSKTQEEYQEALAEVERLEKMSPEEVRAELRSLGVDPTQEPPWLQKALDYLKERMK